MLDVLAKGLRRYYNVIDISPCKGVWTKELVNLPLYVARTVLKSHNGYVERFLASVRHDGKLVSVIRVHAPLVKEGGAVNDCNVRAALNCSNDVGLQRERIDIRLCDPI